MLKTVQSLLTQISADMILAFMYIILTSLAYKKQDS